MEVFWTAWFLVVFLTAIGSIPYTKSARDMVEERVPEFKYYGLY